jgi:hypothetical protein
MGRTDAMMRIRGKMAAGQRVPMKAEPTGVSVSKQEAPPLHARLTRKDADLAAQPLSRNSEALKGLAPPRAAVDAPYDRDKAEWQYEWTAAAVASRPASRGPVIHPGDVEVQLPAYSG